jgi:hypothetical protein
VWGDRSSRPAGGCASRCVGDEKHRQIDAVGERRCDREDVMSATAWGPDGRRSMIGAFSGNGGCEQSFGMRVGLRIRCAVRVRVVECRAGREVSERRGHLANVEGATAAVMRYGCQRGELFEGCECVVGEGTRPARVFGFGSRVSETQRILFGTGAQQTQNCRMAQTVEVVRNHEDGTGERVVPRARNQGVEPLAGRG